MRCALVRIGIGGLDACFYELGQELQALMRGVPLLGICSLVVGSFFCWARGTGSIPVVWTVSANRFVSDAGKRVPDPNPTFSADSSAVQNFSSRMAQ